MIFLCIIFLSVQKMFVHKFWLISSLKFRKSTTGYILECASQKIKMADKHKAQTLLNRFLLVFYFFHFLFIYFLTKNKQRWWCIYKRIKIICPQGETIAKKIQFFYSSKWYSPTFFFFNYQKNFQAATILVFKSFFTWNSKTENRN